MNFRASGGVCRRVVTVRLIGTTLRFTNFPFEVRLVD
jgi:hypothetical protein